MVVQARNALSGHPCSVLERNIFVVVISTDVVASVIIAPTL